MILKILNKDFLNNKVITVAIFIFIMLSAILISCGTSMFIDLNNSLDYFMGKADAPHFSQYHSGIIDQEAIDRWSKANPMVKVYQTSEMINIEGKKIFFNQVEYSQDNSVMDNAFVTQNEHFDFLLDLDNKMVTVNNGEIAVPIFYMQRYDLEIGDTLYIKDKNTEITFTITDFVRDVQMNPSILSSKRFVISESDFQTLKKAFGEIEYIISFKINDLTKISKFANHYGSSNLPQKGPAVDYQLIKIANSITDGLVAAVIILISLLLNIIALLCLRFTILSTIEEDYREIGVMKAIGIRPYDIKRIYIAKYFIISFSASIVGFIISILLNKHFSKNIMLYIGTAPKSLFKIILPLLATFIIFTMVIIICIIILRRFDKISAIDAIRIGSTGETYRSKKGLSLYRYSFVNANIFLGLRDVIQRFKLYMLLFFVFIVCTSVIIVPLNFINTIQSPDIVKYMGLGKCDMLIFLRQSDNTIETYNEMIDYIKNDPEVMNFAPFITCKYKVLNKDSYEESLTVETGDFSVFPIEYTHGLAPKLDNEIALSHLSAKELKKGLGDEIQLMVNGSYKTMIVSGIYQDITNGGKTAKASITPNHNKAVWYIINIEFDGDIIEKINEYKELFPEAKINDVMSYLQQTFGNTIDQLKLVTVLAIVLAILVSILITSLFLKMLIAKDSAQIAIMRAIGLASNDIKIQYITRSLIVLNLGVIIGTIVSNILGERILSMVLSIVGASNIKFVINPLEAYVFTPIILMVIVTITTLISIGNIKRISMSDISHE
ncbi:FtsX-like permease family protein [Clostridium sp. 'deep sea']|uniref:ABC transporter permease n=1 Tax=Clostridium sp. 'deep sea' TaxID=2779445 RepID=UPI001896A086|nr:FtsX-like permease family protein [Clostridium sp. 'deep sea']QOR34755.1 FtsX-like permease family protein [Clostridium sp. 'deep sea']